MNPIIHRRDFLAAGAALAASLLLPAARAAAPERLRLGVVGAGTRGQALARALQLRGDIDVVALSDTDAQACQRALGTQKMDGVIIAAAPERQVPMAIAAMRSGVPVACEAMSGISLRDHRAVLDAQLETGTPYTLLDASAHRRDVMAVLQMVRAGVLGELTHLRGDYHPCALYANINRGNRITRISASRPGEPSATTLSCANGETIVLRHDSAGFRVQGSKGLWMDQGHGVHVAGISPPHQWDDFQLWQDRYDHPLWKTHAGRPGAETPAVHAFVAALKARTPMIDIYDVLTWSAIKPLSRQSIAQNFQTLDFPDFTDGQWRTRRPLYIA